MVEEARKAGEALPFYTVRLRGNVATFVWSSSPENPLKGSIDLRMRLPSSEVLWLAKNLGCHCKRSQVQAQSLNAYNRLLVYACVRPSLRSIEKAKRLAALVSELNSWDAHYWASRFRELWWKHRNYRSLLKVITAFRLFFDLE